LQLQIFLPSIDVVSWKSAAARRFTLQIYACLPAALYNAITPCVCVKRAAMRCLNVPPRAASPVGETLPDDRSLTRNEDGTTAVEFALIGGPFIMMLLGIMAICIYFFTILEVENAVWQGSRDLRVGNYQQNLGIYNINPANPNYNNLMKTAFKNQICSYMRGVLDRQNKMRIIVQTYAGFGSIVQPSCTQANGELVADSSINAGGANSIVLITGCMSWKMVEDSPWFWRFGNMPDGSHLIQTSYVFRTEPYN
jgi:Flp pilus assembly protein TadG